MAGLPRHCDRVDVGRGVTEGFRLVPCEPDGFPVERKFALPDQARWNCEISAAWYRKVGHILLWIGYIAAMRPAPPARWSRLRGRRIRRC